MTAADYHSVDYSIDLCLRLNPDCRPGERMLAGKPYVYDADLLLSFKARELVNGAPADLSGLTDAELDALNSAGMRRWFDTQHAEAGDFRGRVFAESAARAAASHQVAA